MRSASESAFPVRGLAIVDFVTRYDNERNRRYRGARVHVPFIHAERGELARLPGDGPAQRRGLAEDG
jgi:hypothetical protein